MNSLPELRTGTWTRFGGSKVLGDVVTEHTLAGLAESTRIAASSQGYAVGWVEGQRAAREEAFLLAVATQEDLDRREQARAHEHADAVAALQLAASRLHDAVSSTCAAIEDRASTLAWELTQELIGRELVSAEGVDVVRRVLDLLPGEQVARVVLHPDDLGSAAPLLDTGVAVVSDPSLHRGDAIVEVADSVLDLRLDRALHRVREVLR
ncbi:MAG: hypothetical protein JWR52_2576 [Marmoricola sp.]|nr:hypothetical protein [Marmoricola sp.]